MIYLYVMYVLFYLGQLSHFPSCCGAGVTNLNEPLSSFLLPPCWCRLGAGSIPFTAIVNKKQCEMRGLFMSLVIHYWIGDVQYSQGVSASEMTYIVSGGALNSIHSLAGGVLTRGRFRHVQHVWLNRGPTKRGPPQAKDCWTLCRALCARSLEIELE